MFEGLLELRCKGLVCFSQKVAKQSTERCTELVPWELCACPGNRGVADTLGHLMVVLQGKDKPKVTPRKALKGLAGVNQCSVTVLGLINPCGSGGLKCCPTAGTNL